MTTQTWEICKKLGCVWVGKWVSWTNGNVQLHITTSYLLTSFWGGGVALFFEPCFFRMYSLATALDIFIFCIKCCIYILTRFMYIHTYIHVYVYFLHSVVHIIIHILSLFWNNTACFSLFCCLCWMLFLFYCMLFLSSFHDAWWICGSTLNSSTAQWHKGYSDNYIMCYIQYTPLLLFLQNQQD